MSVAQRGANQVSKTVSPDFESNEIILEPHHSRNGRVYWESAQDFDSSPTLWQALLRLLWELVRLTFRLIIWLIKWVIVIAYYALIVGLFVLAFSALFSSLSSQGSGHDVD